MKSPRFNPETSIILVPTLASMSDQQLSDLYYDEDDKSRILKDVKRTIHQMQLGNDHDRHCSRGLEHMLSSDHLQSLLAERDALCDAVLDELDRQWEGNSGDDTSVVD